MANYLVAIDPGLRVIGCALFKDRVLQQCKLLRSPEDKLRGPFAWKAMSDKYLAWLREIDPDIQHNWVFCSEWPQIYRTAKSDPDNLLQLAAVVGLCSFVTIGDKYVYLPRTWKGNIEKHEHQKTIMASLTPSEADVFLQCAGAPSLMHNVLDAVGIGLFHLMRLRKHEKAK